MELPDSKGVYILLAWLNRTQSIGIGQLGQFSFSPGHYVYVGSACGHGGIRARVGHHLESRAQPHWHIDYLLAVATPIEVWYAISDRKLERDWADMLQHSSLFHASIPRFGSSDYRRSRTTHLFYSKQRPSFQWFEAKVRESFEPRIQPQQLILSSKLNKGS